MTALVIILGLQTIAQLGLYFRKDRFGVVMRVLADNQANLDLLTTLAIEQSGQLPG